MNEHLIWRLRNNDTAKHLCGLAADEIERLQEVLEEAAKVAEHWRDLMLAAGVNDEPVICAAGSTLADNIRALRTNQSNERKECSQCRYSARSPL